jgi:hypothetical protein
MHERKDRPILSLFARGIMFNPQAETATVIDTDAIDCTTAQGRARKRFLEQMLFRKPSR